MNTSEHLLWARDTTQRSAFVSYQPTDHDPTAHRHAVQIDATVRVSGGELRAKTCRLRTLSLGGALVDIDRLPAGTLINLTFGLPTVDERLSVDAVVHSSSKDGVNVLFDSLRAWEVWVLWRFLAGLEDDESDLEPTTMMPIIREVALDP
jgi:PilZ domain